MTIGSRIKKQREEIRLSIDELSKILSIPLNTLTQYEKDEILPTKNDLRKLANYFGVSKKYLLEGGKVEKEINKQYLNFALLGLGILTILSYFLVMLFMTDFFKQPNIMLIFNGYTVVLFIGIIFIAISIFLLVTNRKK